MESTDKGSGGRRIRGVLIAFDIIEALQRNGQQGVTDLSNKLGYSKSTVHSHLRTLKDAGMVVQRGNEYHLSLKILNVARDVRNQVVNYDVVKKQVDLLAEETGEIVQFGLEEDGRVAYLYKASGEKAVKTASSVGEQQPMHSTALGKTMLAFASDEKRKSIIDSLEFERKTENTITNRNELHDELDRVADQGFAVDAEENIEGLVCVAAPVRDGKTVYGAISISMPSSRVTRESIENTFADHVQRAANVIELNTRFH